MSSRKDSCKQTMLMKNLLLETLLTINTIHCALETSPNQDLVDTHHYDTCHMLLSQQQFIFNQNTDYQITISPSTHRQCMIIKQNSVHILIMIQALTKLLVPDPNTDAEIQKITKRMTCQRNAVRKTLYDIVALSKKFSDEESKSLPQLFVNSLTSVR